MDKQTIALLATVFLMLAPVIAISYLMTAKSTKARTWGYYGLSAFLFLVCGGFFAMAVSGENRAGFVWMAPVAYGTYWAWNKARSQGRGL